MPSPRPHRLFRVATWRINQTQKDAQDELRHTVLLSLLPRIETTLFAARGSVEIHVGRHQQRYEFIAILSNAMNPLRFNSNAMNSFQLSGSVGSYYTICWSVVRTRKKSKTSPTTMFTLMYLGAHDDSNALNSLECSSGLLSMEEPNLLCFERLKKRVAHVDTDVYVGAHDVY